MNLLLGVRHERERGRPLDQLHGPGVPDEGPLPEHLELIVEDAQARMLSVRNAGAVFVGPFSPVALGDYVAGTNHILPTGGVARLRGGLSAADFVKTISVQHLSRSGLSRLRRSIVTLAETEGLKAHANSVEMRFCTNASNP